MMRAILLVALLLTGCDAALTRVVALPTPAPEQPPCALPFELHQRNWLGPLNQGSCVHASFVNHLRWANRLELADYWRRTYADGEWATRLRSRLDDEGVDYVFTEKADPRFLDWCSSTRRGCILWWKPSHCCTFMGWITRNGSEHAFVLDNNYPGKYETHPREQFIRLWSGYGGFGLSVASPPTVPLPYRSYEVIQ